MQKTNILIAATQEESGVERLEISDFIRCLNECCVDKGHFFTLVYDDVSKSAERPDYDCAKFNLAFFLFSGAADARLQEVYNRAIASYNLSGMPVIALNEHSERDIRAGIEQRPDDFPRSTMHYIRSYSHVDTLKLGILMQIKQIGLSYVDIRLENGRAWQGNEALLRLDNVDAVRGYEHLQSLKSDFLLLDYEFNAAKAHYEDNPDDGDAYDAFFDASVRRNEASREIQDIEMQLFHMIEGMYEHTTRGNLSKRRTEGYRLVERGFLSEAREVLDFDAIVRESRSDSDDDGEDSAAVRALAHISEQMQLKDVNASLLDWDAVDACYREAMRLEEWFNLPRKATLEYVDFLSDQNRFAECVAVAEVLRSYYGRAMGQASAGERAQLLRLLGLSYLEIKRFADGESCCKEAVEVASGAGGAGSAEAAGAAGAEGGTGAAATESGTRAA
ncbi:MAG: hypothetical protein FWH33_10230, partial [Oscillospiraceae bacterium]|nr:hypothetical protein [Oscillospiraceae bacterium]